MHLITKPRGIVVLCFVVLCGCTTASVRPVDYELLSAANAVDHSRFDAALQQGANVNATNEQGWTPLMSAARAGDVTLVAELLQRGARVNARNSDGQTALMVCDARVVKVLVDGGAAFDVTGGMLDETPLMAAPDVDKTRALLAAGAPVNYRNDGGNSALWFATLRGQTDLIRLLVEAGADVNVSNGMSTPLLVAAGQADAETIRLLLNAGADAHVRNLKGETPLHWAAKNLRRGVVEAVLAAKPEVNAQADDGRTALMLAAQDGYTENVRALLAAGADPNIRSGAGQSPIEWAEAKGNHELAALLRSAGATLAAGGTPDLPSLKRGARTGELSVFTTDLGTDGRFAKIRGRVSNGYSERVEGIRYEVILTASDTSPPRDTLRYQTATSIEPGADAPLKLDVESMYFGSDMRILIRALPVKVGGRELPPPPGWKP